MASTIMTGVRMTRFPPSGETNRPISRGGGDEAAKQGPALAPQLPRHIVMQAEALSNSEAFVAIIDELRKGSFLKFENSDTSPAGAVAREEAYYELKALDSILSRIQSFRDDAELHRRREREEAEAE